MTKSHSRGGPKGRGEGLGRNFKSCGKEKGISPDPGAWRSSGVQGEMQKPHLCLGLLEGDRSVQPQRAVWAEVTRQGQGPRALGRWQHKCPQAAVQDPSAFRAQAKSGTTWSRVQQVGKKDGAGQQIPEVPGAAQSPERPPTTSSTLAAAHNLPETAQTF